jgi:hypothetical protein
MVGRCTSSNNCGDNLSINVPAITYLASITFSLSYEGEIFLSQLAYAHLYILLNRITLSCI